MRKFASPEAIQRLKDTWDAAWPAAAEYEAYARSRDDQVDALAYAFRHVSAGYAPKRGKLRVRGRAYGRRVRATRYQVGLKTRVYR